jgi:hypothetical protein
MGLETLARLKSKSNWRHILRGFYDEGFACSSFEVFWRRWR